MRAKVAQGLYIPAPKLNELRILKQIASDPNVTQAELADRCMLSVAMVNNYMKELLGRGLLEYRRKSTKTISYHLTDRGREAVEDMRRELLLELVRLFADAKERVREIIMSQSGGDLRRVVLYGSGDLAELAFHALESADVDIVGVCDDDPSLAGREWCGREMLKPSQIRYLAPDSVIVACNGHTDEVCNSLAYLVERGIRLIRLDSPSVFHDPPSLHDVPDGLRNV